MTPRAIDPETLGMLRAMWPEPCRIHVGQVPSGEPSLRVTQYVTMPGSSHPTVLIPRRPAPVAHAGLRDYKSPTTWRARAETEVLRFTARSGGLRALPARLTIVVPPNAPTLLNHLASDEPRELACSIQLGPPRANRKPVLHLIRERGQSVGFAKVGLCPLTRARVDNETSALRTLSEHSFATLRVPRVSRAGSWGALNFALLDPLQTRSSEGVVAHTRDLALRELTNTFPRTETELGSSVWWARLQEALLNNPASAAHGLRRIADTIRERAGSHPLTVGAMHGDWSPWNVMTTGGRTHAWDWERFELDAPVGLDALNYSFRERVRLRAQDPRDALAATATRAREMVTANGGDAEQHTLVLALFLLDLGERYVRQADQGGPERHGAIHTWLTPVLQESVDDLC